MKPSERTIALAHIAGDIKALTLEVARELPGTMRRTILEPRLIRAMADVEVWRGLGWPQGGSGEGTRSSTRPAPLPERVATALADAELVDVFALESAEADLRLARVREDVRWLARFQARHTPTRRHPDDRTTATCNGNAAFPGCGRVVADTPADRLRAGLCTACYHRARRATPATCSCAIYGAAPCNHAIEAGGATDATERATFTAELAAVSPTGAGLEGEGYAYVDLAELDGTARLGVEGVEP